MGIQVNGGGGAGTVTDAYPLCQGRLTLTSGTPVTTSDVTAATTLYFTPYLGDLVGLHDGADWEVFQFTERSIAIPATTNTNYDVFLYDNSGTLTLELVAWTNATTRATALATQDGVYVKSGDTTRRYLGTIRTTGVSGQVEDSEAKRFVWNYYNRMKRKLRVAESTSHTYSNAAWRAWNNDTTVITEFVCGVNEQEVIMTQTSSMNTNTGQVMPALDGSTLDFQGPYLYQANDTVPQLRSDTKWLAGQIGYHYYQVQESSGGGNVNFVSCVLNWILMG